MQQERAAGERPGCPRASQGLPGTHPGPAGWLCSAQMPLSVPFVKPWLSILSKDSMLSQENQTRVYCSACVCMCVCGGEDTAGRADPAPHLYAPPRPRWPRVCVCVCVCVCVGRGGECHGNTVPFKHGSLCCRRKAALGNLIKELAADKLCELKAFY